MTSSPIVPTSAADAHAATIRSTKLEELRARRAVAQQVITDRSAPQVSPAPTHQSTGELGGISAQASPSVSLAALQTRLAIAQQAITDRSAPQASPAPTHQPTGELGGTSAQASSVSFGGVTLSENPHAPKRMKSAHWKHYVTEDAFPLGPSLSPDHVTTVHTGATLDSSTRPVLEASAEDVPLPPAVSAPTVLTSPVAEPGTPQPITPYPLSYPVYQRHGRWATVFHFLERL